MPSLISRCLVLLFPAGGFPYELTEGDIICVFSQYVSFISISCNVVAVVREQDNSLSFFSQTRVRYGEVVNINLVRDKKTGKSKGFCFICYEDQRSTILAVDNFNGIKVTRCVTFVKLHFSLKLKTASVSTPL